MIFWSIQLLIVTLMCAGFRVRRFSNTGISSAASCYSVQKQIFCITCIELIVIAGLRSGIGDTGYYMYNFVKYRGSSIKEIIPSKEPGFKIIAYLLGKVTDNPQVFLFVFSAVTLVLILQTLYKNSEDVVVSVFLFVAAGFYLGTMNGLRQYFVVAVLFACSQLIINGEWKKFFLITVLLSTIHTSALIMVPIYFFVRSEAWSIKKLLFAVAVFLLLSLSGGFVNVIAGFIEEGQYSVYAESLRNDTANGANIVRIIVMCLPALLSFVGYRLGIRPPKHSFENLCVNMSILSALTYCMAYTNWVFARIAMYFSLYGLFVYPYYIKRIFNKSSVKLVHAMMFLLFTVYYYFELRNTPYMSYYLNINVDLIGPLTNGFYQN